MILSLKRFSQNILLFLGVLGIAPFLIGFTGTDSEAAQQDTRTNQEQTKPATDDSQKTSVRTKPHSWTLLCQHENGTQGVFRVTSTVAEEERAAAPKPNTRVEESSKDAKSDEMGTEDSATPDPDPFEDTTLECGRLLTLLAIFAIADSQTP